MKKHLKIGYLRSNITLLTPKPIFSALQQELRISPIAALNWWCCRN